MEKSRHAPGTSEAPVRPGGQVVSIARDRSEVDGAWRFLEAVIRSYGRHPDGRNEEKLEHAILRFREACQADALAKWRGEAGPRRRRPRQASREVQ